MRVGMWWTLQMGVACAWVGVLDYCFKFFNILTVIHPWATPGTAGSLSYLNNLGSEGKIPDVIFA